MVKTHGSELGPDENNNLANIGQHLGKSRIPSPHGPHRRPLKKRPLEKDEEFLEYKYVDMPDGTQKRKKVIKKTEKHIKFLT